MTASPLLAVAWSPSMVAIRRKVAPRPLRASTTRSPTRILPEVTVPA
ncbi:hypothetical protein [Methyloceanibacter marginalis]|nr:hypothetical protein [Methyloceanibacter marginalis]